MQKKRTKEEKMTKKDTSPLKEKEQCLLVVVFLFVDFSSNQKHLPTKSDFLQCSCPKANKFD